MCLFGTSRPSGRFRPIAETRESARRKSRLALQTASLKETRIKGDNIWHIRQVCVFSAVCWEENRATFFFLFFSSPSRGFKARSDFDWIGEAAGNYKCCRWITSGEPPPTTPPSHNGEKTRDGTKRGDARRHRKKRKEGNWNGSMIPGRMIGLEQRQQPWSSSWFPRESRRRRRLKAFHHIFFFLFCLPSSSTTTLLDSLAFVVGSALSASATRDESREPITSIPQATNEKEKEKEEPRKEEGKGGF